jgi:putative phage-type endonuclease
MKNRQYYIGGSDVADVFSIEPYGCKRKLWYEKTGESKDYAEDNYHLRRGTMLEPLAASLYEERTGRKIRKNNAKLIDEEYPFMAAHLDREILKDERGVGVLELKCPSAHIFSEVQRAGAQEAYILQLQHYLYVRKAQWGSYGFFSAELADIFWFDVDRDDELIQKMIEGELAFWEMVQRKEIPDKLASSKDRRCKKCSYGITCQGLLPDEGVDDALLTMIADEEFDRILEGYWQAKAIFDDAEEYYEGLKERIKAKMETFDSAYAIVNNTKVYYPTLDGRNTWDGKKLEKDHPELIEKYRKQGKPYKRLSLYHTK